MQYKIPTWEERVQQEQVLNKFITYLTEHENNNLPL